VSAIDQQILEEMKMLNANIQKLNVTMTKPRPKRLSLGEQWRKTFADYLAKGNRPGGAA